MASADPQTLRGRPWAGLVFHPEEVPYDEGVWQGPLLVLVDRYTGSAAEEFAAELQDNHAAIIVGETTYGVGCGHTDGGTPTKLLNSGAILELPDCARFRADGSNEVRGVVPDVLLGFRKSDNARLKAVTLMAKMSEALNAVDAATK
jgi:C-terminal processing protease CtpA/Prc